MTSAAEKQHQHRYRPGSHTSAGPLRFIARLECKCGSYVQLVPGLRVRDWKWKYLTYAGVRREWKKACRG